MVSGSHRPLLRHWGRDAWNVSCSLQQNGRRGRRGNFHILLSISPGIGEQHLFAQVLVVCRKGRSKGRGGPISSRRRADPTSIRNHRRVRTEESTTQFMDPPTPRQTPFCIIHFLLLLLQCSPFLRIAAAAPNISRPEEHFFPAGGTARAFRLLQQVS